MRVSFSMQNRGKLPFSWQFTLFVVSSRIAVGICSSLALGNRKPLTIVQKGFLHDKERMIFSDLINEKMTDCTLTNAVGRLLIRFLLLLFRTRTRFRFPCWTARWFSLQGFWTSLGRTLQVSFLSVVVWSLLRFGTMRVGLFLARTVSLLFS